MTILINDQKVDFTMENEKSAYDIYQSIHSFLKDTNHYIYSFTIDGNETDPEKKELWMDKPVGIIDKIEITALSEKEYLLTGLLTVAEYINLLLRSVLEGSEETLSDLMHEYPSIINNLPLLIKGNQGMLIRDYMNKIINNSGLLDETFNEDYRDVFVKEIGDIARLINTAAKEIENPQSELSASIEILGSLIPQINEVSLLLQVGKDKEAMNLIIQLTELLQKITRLISFYNTDNIYINEKSYNVFSTELNAILTELAGAFDVNDSVLIGDLLEYELTPKLDMLPEVIQSIINMEDE
ncbi:MAG: hypothetical protein JEY91_17025 [Spirochaetaceae bacterium]|nr:hypothetical protein [Spirochaetaceae bacterium]